MKNLDFIWPWFIIQILTIFSRYSPAQGSIGNKEAKTVFARERAPAAANQDMFVNKTGASSVGEDLTTNINN